MFSAICPPGRDYYVLSGPRYFLAMELILSNLQSTVEFILKVCK